MSSYSTLSILLPLMVTLLQPMKVYPLCEPVEEGKSFSLTCFGTTCLEPLLFWWRTAQKHISYCDTNLECTGNNDITTISIVKKNNSAFESQLTIPKVSRANEVTWTCENCDNVAASCPLKIYVKPVNIDCQATEVSDSDGVLTSIKIECTMNEVYPYTMCYFLLDFEGKSTTSPPGSCSTFINVGKFHEGRNVIMVRVGSGLQPNFDQLEPIRAKPDIVLRLPRSKIECSSEYKDGYYKGESVSCNCTLEDEGKPAAVKSAFFEGSNVYQPIYALHPPDDLNITCAGESAIGRESPGNKFSPKFAFLRLNAIVFTTVYEDGPDNSSNAAVLAICEIAISEVNPTPRMVFLVDAKEASSYQTNTNNAGWQYRSSLRFHPKVGGVFKLACRVENTVFFDLVDEVASRNVVIHSSVQLSEAFKVRTFYYSKVEPGYRFSISIDVTAYPKPINFTLFRGNPDQNNTVDNNDVHYLERSPSTGTVDLTISVELPSDLTVYSLVMDNGVGDSLVYSFTLEEDTEEDMTYVYIIVGVISGVIVITAVVFLVWWRKKRTKSDSDNLSPSDKDEEVYVEENIYHLPVVEDVYEAPPVENEKSISPSVKIPTAPAPAPKPKRPYASKENVNNRNKGSIENVGTGATNQDSMSKDNVDAKGSKTKLTDETNKEVKQPYVNVNSDAKVPRRKPPLPRTLSKEQMYVNQEQVERASKNSTSLKDEDGDYLNVRDSGNSSITNFSSITERGANTVLY